MKRLAPFFVWMGLLSTLLLGGCFEDRVNPGIEGGVHHLGGGRWVGVGYSPLRTDRDLQHP